MESVWQVACPSCRANLCFTGKRPGLPQACACGSCGSVFRAAPGNGETGSSTSQGINLSGDPVLVRSPNVLVAASVLLLLLSYIGEILLFMAACILFGGFMLNPIHHNADMQEGWRLLHERRAKLLEARDRKDLKKWKVFKVLKNAVVDTVHRLHAQPVAVNMIFATLVYIDSKSAVDRELCAIGFVGCWQVLEMSPLRNMAAHCLKSVLVQGEAMSSGNRANN
mmetsp:Transcript_36902/g.69421  ORF Transcript_36902/g.69421 Transcript_36902/m.69421 type:complete len:224 (+) Transcript_36902:111-782(+)